MKYIIALLFAVNANASVLDLNLSKKWNINGVPVGHEATSMGVKLSLLGTGTATKKLGVSKATRCSEADLLALSGWTNSA